SVRPGEADSRLQSALQLLDTVLSPSEAIVFRRDRDAGLIFSARLRDTQNGSADRTLSTARNSAWRSGVSLCERAIDSGEIVVEKHDGDDAANIALPLRHEDHTVGAVLIRVTKKFDED